MAAAGGYHPATQSLIHHKANAHAKNTGGLTALHCAAGKGTLAGVKLLLQAGVDPSSRSDWGNSASDLAQTAGHHVVHRLLHRIEAAKIRWPHERYPDRHLCFMNLIPRIINPKFVMEVPYVSDYHDYDFLGFFQFPERMGWKHSFLDKRSQLVPSDKTEKSQEEHASVLQAWLFFGMLAEVLAISGLEMKIIDFVHWNGTRLLRTTALLSDYLGQWAEKEKSFEISVQQQHVVRFDACIQEASAFADANLAREGLYTMSCPLSGEVSLSILMLGEILANARNSIWDQQTRLHGDSKHANAIISNRGQILGTPGEISEQEFPVLSFLKPGNFTYDRMISSKWCKSEVTMLHRNLRPTSLFLASMLDRPAMKKEHPSCSENQCFANQIIDEDYKTAHVENCPGCAAVAVDTHEISRILSLGHIPSVAIDVSTQDKIVSLRVVDEEATPYVAISHVWSHGLGNVEGNALPRCQLLRLKETTQALYKKNRGGGSIDPSLWIDTLCIPRELEGRKLALKMLRRSFERADKVLVLDAELAQATSMTSTVEILARILCCGWLRGLWTLEEALVARDKLQFQFLEGSIDVYSHVETMVKGVRADRPLSSSGCLDLVQTFGNFVPSKFGRHVAHLDFEFLGVSLQYRTTSKKEDEIICLASLLGLDVGKLVQCPTEKRVTLFYSLLGTNKSIPSSILFVDGPRLEDDGYRWAPSTFLTTSHVAMLDLHIPFPAAIHGTFGLEVAFPGWMWDWQGDSRVSMLWFEDLDGGCLYTI